MRVPKRKQRALMLRLFKWTTPKDWYYDGHVWKMTPEAEAVAKKKRAAAEARYERIFKKEMSITEALSRRNPLWAAAERSDKFTLVTDGQRYGAIHPGHLLPSGHDGWHVVKRNLSSLEAAQDAAIDHAESMALMETLPPLKTKKNPKRRRNPLGDFHPDSPQVGDIVKPTQKTKKERHLDDPKGYRVETVGRHGSYGVPYGAFNARGVKNGGLYHFAVGETVPISYQRNPLPASAPSRALLCIGQLRDLELFDPKTGRTGHLKPKGKWLAWDGKQFQICNVRGQVNASLPSNVVAKHRKFHAANPQGKPFLASMPDRGPTVKNVGLLKSLVYYVPSKIRSPGKNKYLWHHAFGDTGHKGGDSYPTKVMPMLQRDSAGNLFIKRRPGNIFQVDNWLRG